MATIAWFVSSLEQKGGGERFVLEASRALRSAGHRVIVICDRLDEKASFDGTYDLSDIVCTGRDYNAAKGYFGRLTDKLGGLRPLIGTLRRERPDLTICQSEFDAIKLWICSRFVRLPYAVFVFGQMFQFRTDLTRYAVVFRRHLHRIRSSRPGYLETVRPTAPNMSLPVRAANETLSLLKYRALRRAKVVFTLSLQVAWEVSLVYGRSDAKLLRAGLNEDFIDPEAVTRPTPVGQPVRLLSVSRLVDKKRIDRLIDAVARTTIPLELRIVGTGPDERALKTQAAASPKAHAITFLGSVDDRSLADEIAAADCFISLDIGDYDISVVEAMAKGKRVIVTRDFDLESFGSRFTGAVSVEPQVDAIAAAIDAIPNMTAPSAANLPELHQQTWGSLADRLAQAALDQG